MKFVKYVVYTLLILLITQTALAAPGSTTITRVYTNNEYYARHEITFTCTASTTTGAFLNGTTTFNVEGFVALALVVEGTPAPTNGFDIVINDSNGIDVMGGELADGGVADPPAQAIPQLQTDVMGGRWVRGPLTISISNNSVNSAAVTVILTVVR